MADVHNRESEEPPERGEQQQRSAAEARRERERDRDELRQRARARQRAQERDQERYQDREDERRRRYGYQPNSYDVVRDLNRLAYAASRASMQAYVGTSQVLGDLLLNLTDSYYSNWQGYTRTYADEGDQYEGRPPRRRAARDFSSDVSGTVSDAVRNTADVFARSADEFSRVYDDEHDRDREFDDRVAEGEDAESADESTGRTRRRHKKSEP